MKLRSWYVTDVGLRRELNEDSVLVDERIGLYVVADGMGGHRGGEIASALAVESAHRSVMEASRNGAVYDPYDVIMRCFSDASSSIFERSRAESDKLRGMGTTMVMALAYQNTMYIGNVGDSRAYLFKKPYLWQLTEDHSLVNDQIRAGVLPEDAPAHLLGRNVITRSVGYEREVLVDILDRPCEAGEVFILCSDGLSSLVGDFELSAILNQNPLPNVSRLFVELAKARGGDDNITIVIIEVLST